MKLIIILVVIIAFCITGYYLLIQFSRPKNPAKYPAPPFVQLSPTSFSSPSPTAAQTTPCTNAQLQATIAAQGAAGSIYGKLKITNIGKTACSMELGNTVTETTTATTIITHYQKTAPKTLSLLKPGNSVYSQIHYPNGPQCSRGITPKPITFFYKSAHIAVAFQSITPHLGTLMIQVCTSPNEKTTVDIWPLSKSPITP